MRILVVEDHGLLRDQIAGLLRDAGHVVEEASDGRLGLQMALEQPPDVLVLDLGLPGLDGVRLCRALRETAPAHVPVLMLTARDSLDDKAQGFDAGADDYLVKPFAAEELLWRCRALSRRHRLGQPHVLVLGDLRVDRNRCQAERAGQPLDLPPIGYQLLLQLAQAWPRIVTRSELVRSVWGDEPPDSDPLRSHLYLLRQVLDKPFATPMLKTVHGVGYTLEPQGD
ncbi:MAG: response regulator transcription factor [Rubrivivax sp.]|nr:response regulator transcription factor [Rubrivivax sp.]